MCRNAESQQCSGPTALVVSVCSALCCSFSLHTSLARRPFVHSRHCKTSPGDLCTHSFRRPGLSSHTFLNLSASLCVLLSPADFMVILGQCNSKCQSPHVLVQTLGENRRGRGSGSVLSSMCLPCTWPWVQLTTAQKSFTEELNLEMLCKTMRRGTLCACMYVHTHSHVCSL